MRFPTNKTNWKSWDSICLWRVMEYASCISYHLSYWYEQQYIWMLQCRYYFVFQTSFKQRVWRFELQWYLLTNTEREMRPKLFITYCVLNSTIYLPPAIEMKLFLFKWIHNYSYNQIRHFQCLSDTCNRETRSTVFSTEIIIENNFPCPANQ